MTRLVQFLRSRFFFRDYVLFNPDSPATDALPIW